MVTDMKFCYECGYKLEGHEEVCPQCGSVLKLPKDIDFFDESILNQFFYELGTFMDNARLVLLNMEISDIIGYFSKTSKRVLNRDEDYIKRARKKLGNIREADKVLYLCNKALLIDDRNWETYYLKGRALINLKRYDEAIEELISSLVLNKDNLKAREYIAKASYLKGDLDYANSVFDSILNIREKHHEALLGKASIYFDKKEYDKANKFFKKANDISPLENLAHYKWELSSERLNKK